MTRKEKDCQQHESEHEALLAKVQRLETRLEAQLCDDGFHSSDMGSDTDE